MANEKTEESLGLVLLLFPVKRSLMPVVPPESSSEATLKGATSEKPSEPTKPKKKKRGGKT